MKTETINGVRVGYERRWYGRKCFTWLLYLVGNKWEAYEGDPWPSSRIPKKELAAAIAQIKTKLKQSDTSSQF